MNTLIRAIIVILGAGLHALAQGGEMPSRCLGAPSGHPLLFLQGISDRVGPMKDSATSEWLSALDGLGQRNGWRIAVPFSQTPCRNDANRFCWGSDDKASVADTWKTVVSSAGNCLGRDHPWGVVGFSNGGYHATRVVLWGLSPQPGWVIAIGSAGILPTARKGVRLADTRLHLVIGQDDPSREAAQRFHDELIAEGYRTELTLVPGAHNLPLAQMPALISREVSR